MARLLRCTACGRYTLAEACPCGGAAASPKPPKYSPEDRFARFRRQAKEGLRKEEGLL